MASVIVGTGVIVGAIYLIPRQDPFREGGVVHMWLKFWGMLNEDRDE